MVAAIAIEWLITTDHSSHLANMFLTGEFNHGFTLGLFCLGFLSTGSTIVFALWVKQHAKTIDILEKVKEKRNEEEKLYIEEINRYTRGI